MEYPRVTAILSNVGISDFTKVHAQLLEDAGHFGTAFHSARHMLDMETLDEATLSEPLIPYVSGYKQFRKDFNIIVLPDESERQFISKKWGFKGTPDIWPVIQGNRTLIDTKTSAQMYPATAIQIAAYQILLEENGIKVHQRWGLQLNEKGTYKIIPYTNVADRTVFLSAVTLYNWKKENL